MFFYRDIIFGTANTKHLVQQTSRQMLVMGENDV